MLLRAPILDSAELHVLDQIDDLRRKLRFALDPSSRWEGLIRKATLADEPTTTADAPYQRAMNYILQLSADPLFRCSADLLRSLHYMMLEDAPEQSPGQWRSRDYVIRDPIEDQVTYYGPDPDEVPDLIDELVADLNSDSSAGRDVIGASMAHLNLVLIHPFRDGNRRIALALQTLVLARSGMTEPAFASIWEYWERNRPESDAVLARVMGDRWDPRRDARPWIRFCLTAHYRQILTLLRRIERVRKVWNRVERHVQLAKLSRRTTLALVDATLGHRVRNVTYRKAAGISEFLASRDLRALVESGLLIPHGERRGRFYVAADSLRSIRAATRSNEFVEDPLLTTRDNEMGSAS